MIEPVFSVNHKECVLHEELLERGMARRIRSTSRTIRSVAISGTLFRAECAHRGPLFIRFEVRGTVAWMVVRVAWNKGALQGPSRLPRG